MINDYQQFDAVALRDMVANGDVTALELLDTARSLAEDINPALNAIVTPMYEEARKAAAAPLSGPLAGVPFLIKDIAYVKDVPCTFGSRLWADYIPEHDAELISRYRKAGLVIFGKTNTPEVGLACTTEPVLFGPSRNPWDLDRTTGGSSGGSGAAVAAGILPAAHATDGGGSIRIPASCCGLVGLKPTRARTPLGPDLGEGWGSMATAHVVSRSVRDSALLLDATHGPARGDPYHAPRFDGSFLDVCSIEPGKLRIAIDREPINDSIVHPDCIEGLEKVAALCESLGHEVEEVNLGYDKVLTRMATGVLVVANVRNNVIRRAEQAGVEAGPEYLEALTLRYVDAANLITGETYARSINQIHATTRIIEQRFDEYDLILSPTLLQPAVPLGFMDTNSEDGEAYEKNFNEFWGFTNLYNATGNPAISLPLHWSSDNLPVGLQFAASFGNEALLLQISAQLERAQPWFDRRPPLTSK